jgi:hypothetical protein
MDKDEFAEALADQLTHCWASERGCKKLPVRMVAEIAPEGNGTIDMVMLCEDHAVTYRPEGVIISDQTLSDENIAAAKKARW